MSSPLRILMIEDSQEDAELILLHLQAHSVECTCVQVDTLEGFLSKLKSGVWDLVLSDYSLPGTDGMAVLESLRALDPDLPFILLSGVLDEGAAVEAMRKGANDFILKGNLSRLVPVIWREMKESELRRKQRLFEEELRLLHTAIGQTPDMVMITDAEGQILYANAAAEAITGFHRAEMVGQNPRLFKSDRHDTAFYRSMWEVLLRGETWKGHIVNRRKDRSLWDAETVIAPVFNSRGELQNYLCTARDITLERKLQGLVEQSQRLETIGTLTSGIAHDFNNILMPVMGHAELGLARSPGDPKIRHDLEVIQASASRARDLIAQILSFSRKGAGEDVPIEVQSLLSESLKLLRATLPTSMGFEVELDARGTFVKVDPTKLHQVILNLCINASHAMRGLAGRLTVKLKPEHLPVTPCAMNVNLQEGEYLCLEVTDTGRGISSEHLDKVFLPFFTTKPPREGTGLGLSVTHGIVSAAKGGIQVGSQPGVGTSFKIFLPISSSLLGLPVVQGDETVKGHGHILLVDDEKTLVDMLEASLTQMGFQVSSFCDPRLALRAFADSPTAFQIAVTDHTMPGLSGLQLAQAIWSLNPGFPIILMTGDPDMEKFGLPLSQAGFRACLSKPMSPKDLARAVLKGFPEPARLDHDVMQG